MIWPSLETTPKTKIVAWNFVFITLGTLNRPELHFKGAGNAPVVKALIGRVHELYSGASQISLVEHRVTFWHDRRLLSLLGFVHNWSNRRWSAKKKKKENRFSLNGNGIMSSFLGRQFYRSTHYMNWNWHLITYKIWYAIKHNQQTKLLNTAYEEATVQTWPIRLLSKYTFIIVVLKASCFMDELIQLKRWINAPRILHTILHKCRVQHFCPRTKNPDCRKIYPYWWGG